jgi:hypothetical protein
MINKTMHKPNRLIKKSYIKNISINKSLDMGEFDHFDKHFKNYQNILSLCQTYNDFPNIHSIIEDDTVYFYNNTLHRNKSSYDECFVFEVSLFSSVDGATWCQPYKDEKGLSVFSEKFITDDKIKEIYFYLINLVKSYKHSYFTASYNVTKNELYFYASLKNSETEVYRNLQITTVINKLTRSVMLSLTDRQTNKIYFNDNYDFKDDNFLTIDSFKDKSMEFLAKTLTTINQKETKKNDPDVDEFIIDKEDLPFTCDEFYKDIFGSIDVLGMYYY